MERSVLIVSILLTIGCLVESVLSQIKPDEKEMDEEVKRKAFWFGPRLGRRKRNNNGEEPFLGPALEREQLDVLADAIQESPWAIVTMNGPYKGKRKTVNFTPRLGRDSGEDFNSGAVSLGGSVGDRRLLELDLAGELMQRSPPFAPRLGRRVSFSPRLGRENEFKSQY